MKPETLAIHHAHEVDPTTGALTPPIHLSTTFERDLDGDYSRGFKYTRNVNPNRAELEARLAALEGGTRAAVLASGSAAMMTLFQALKTGDHIIAPRDMYFGIQVLLREIMAPWGLETSFVNMADLAAVKAALRPTTRLIVIETPSNPLLKLTDIAATAAIAHEHGALLVCDNTVGTPIFQAPFTLGADIIVHATTKFIAGHSDVLGGALIFREESDFMTQVLRIQEIGGAVGDPFSAWLTMRGMMTLPQRMRAQHHNSVTVARWLEAHPQIERVLHPALESHPQHDLFQRQMTGTTGLFSFLVKGEARHAINVTNHVKIIKRMTSFGGARSKIEHRASIEEGTDTPDTLLRFSVGLEHPDDLIDDLAAALAAPLA